MRLYIDVKVLYIWATCFTQKIHQTNYLNVQSKHSGRINMDLYPNLRAVTIPLRISCFINIVVPCMDLNFGTKLVQQLKTCTHNGEKAHRQVLP